MDIISLAREMGAKLQECDEYIAYQAAKTVADEDQELQEMIGIFNQKKEDLSAEVQKSDRNTDRLAKLNDEVRDLYTKIMKRPSMAAFNTTKGDLDRTIGFVQQIIVSSANGEDPYSVEENLSCGGNCSGCSGCH